MAAMSSATEAMAFASAAAVSGSPAWAVIDRRAVSADATTTISRRSCAVDVSRSRRSFTLVRIGSVVATAGQAVTVAQKTLAENTLDIERLLSEASRRLATEEAKQKAKVDSRAAR